MNHLDSCSVILLIQSTYLKEVIEQNKDYIIDKVVMEVKTNKEKALEECRKKFPEIYMLNLIQEFDGVTGFLRFLESQFEIVETLIQQKPCEIDKKHIDQYMNESRECKSISHETETTLFLHCTKLNSNLTIDDNDAFLFFKNHRDCQIKIHLLYESLLERDIEPKKMLNVLTILHEIYYKNQSQRNPIIKYKIDYLKKILKVKTETIISE